jgi:prepilin-type N-terminal cleavage/methylation domain-containing protein
VSGMRPRGFSMVELLVSIAIIALLTGLLVPALAGARDTARSAVCLSNVRQLGAGWTLYANDHNDWAMPLAYIEPPDVGFFADGVFWFGTDGRVTGQVDYAKGLLSPYVGAAADADGVYECPDQREGTYRPQAATGARTTTYGYNGYYLSPSKTPGWGGTWGPISEQSWKRLSMLGRPSELLVFADTLLWTGPRGQRSWPGVAARSTALLDPPQLWDGVGWSINESPTTAFRHAGEKANGVRADGSARSHRAQPGWLATTERVEGASIGSVGTDNDPAYVPDWQRWR